MSHNTTKINKLILLLGVVLGIVVFTACAGNVSQGPDIRIEEAWARSSPLAEGNGSAYMTIQNKGNEADTLIGVSSSASKAAEIHEMTMEGDVMKMRPVEGQRLEIPARGQVVLKPGGLHVMLLDLGQKLEAGKSIELKLQFEKSGEKVLTVEVRSADGEEMPMESGE